MTFNFVGKVFNNSQMVLLMLIFHSSLGSRGAHLDWVLWVLSRNAFRGQKRMRNEKRVMVVLDL